MKKIHVKIYSKDNKSSKTNISGWEAAMINMKFTLKELRARKNETQQQSAKALGISVQTYNAWEQDISNVAISKVMKVADHFNVTLAEIKV